MKKQDIIDKIKQLPDWQFKPEKGLTKEGLIKQVKDYTGELKWMNGMVVFL